MSILLADKADSYIQFVTVLLIFVFVLGITAFTTKWISKYQKTQVSGANIQVLETTRIATNKVVQIVRVGDSYFAIALGKDTVTLLGEISKDQLKEVNASKDFDFKKILEKAVKKNDTESVEVKENQSNDEV